MYVYMYIHEYIHIYINVCIHIYLYIHNHTYIYTQGRKLSTSEALPIIQESCPSVEAGTFVSCELQLQYTLLQRIATHCNTLPSTATHCNTLQHTAAHCNTL